MSFRPKVCVDTSALVKWFKAEDESSDAVKLRRWAEEAKIKLVISAIVLTECARAFKKAGCDDNEIYEILDMLDAFIGLCGVEVVPVDWLIIKSAQSLVIEHNLYSADAIHAATAILTESDFFVSTDEHHFKEGLKSHLEGRNVRLLRLSEVEKISE
jgi:predicted nucleic acid-binding protein